MTTCPQCGSNRVHRSRRSRLTERMVVLAGGNLRRCHDCNTRYVTFGNSIVRPRDIRKVGNRCLLVLGMGVAAIVIMASVIWLSHSQASSNNESGRIAPACKSGAVSECRAV